MVNFSDFNSVVSKVVVNYVRQVLGVAEEPQHFSVVVEELFLGWDFATS